MLKAYACTDYDLYAAANLEQAKALAEADVGEPCEEGYPRELSDADLDKSFPEFDENERETGRITSVRQILAEHGDEPGWLAGENW